MTLEFQPYFQPDRNRNQESLARLTQTVGGLGDSLQAYRQQQRENAMKQTVLDLQKKQGAREQGVYNYEYGDPNAQPGGGVSYDQNQNMSSQMPPSYPMQSTLPSTPNFTSNDGSQMNVPPSGPMHQPGTDLSGHVMNWMQQGQPSTYNHPEMGGSAYNPNDPYGMGMDARRIGMKAYQQAYASQKEAAGGRVLSHSPVAKSMFGDADPKDLAMFGDQAPGILEKGAELQATNNYRNATLNATNTRITDEQQKPVQEAASKMYGDYVTTDTASSAAKQALAQSQQNPAMFTTALFKVGEALGVKSRNPAMVVQAIAAGDPSLAGSVNEYLAKRGTGRLTPQLLSGLNSMVDTVQQSNKQAFETKASAHIQQNAKYYGGADKAQSALFPNYRFGSNNSANVVPGSPNQTFLQVRLNSKTGEKVGFNGTEWVKIP